MKSRQHQSASKRLAMPNHSTGPRTAEGKAISCLNNPSAQGVSLPVVRVEGKPVGLTGSFCVLKSEVQELFDELRDAFHHEHHPATPTEIILVDRLAEHVWLSQRAQRMQDDAACKGQDNWFALMLRYQTTHDRGFHKCLAELRTVRKERQLAPNELTAVATQFESQKAKTAAADSALEQQASTEPTAQCPRATRTSGLKWIEETSFDIERFIADQFESQKRSSSSTP